MKSVSALLLASAVAIGAAAELKFEIKTTWDGKEVNHEPVQ